MRVKVLVFRHAERADEAGEAWADQATAPHNPPLSAKGWEQARAAGAALAATAAAAATPITHIAVSPFLRCLQTAAGVLEGLAAEEGQRRQQQGGGAGAGAGGARVVEVDPALSEILGPPFLPPGTPWRAGDDAWVWAGGSAEAALRAGGLPASTPVVGPPWPDLLRRLPESLESGHARYDAAIAAAAARAAGPAAGGSGSGSGSGSGGGAGAPTLLLLVTHGEGVRRAVTRVSPAACVYSVAHCGWAACEWRAGGEGGDDSADDPGEWALLPEESAGVAWL